MKVNNKRPILVLSTDRDKAFVEMHGIADKEPAASGMGSLAALPELSLVNIFRESFSSRQAIVRDRDNDHSRLLILGNSNCDALLSVEAIGEPVHHGISDNGVKSEPESPRRNHERKWLCYRHQAELDSLVLIVGLEICQILLQEDETIHRAIHGLENRTANGGSDIPGSLALGKQILQVAIETDIGILENTGRSIERFPFLKLP